MPPPKERLYPVALIPTRTPPLLPKGVRKDPLILTLKAIHPFNYRDERVSNQKFPLAMFNSSIGLLIGKGIVIPLDMIEHNFGNVLDEGYDSLFHFPCVFSLPI